MGTSVFLVQISVDSLSGVGWIASSVPGRQATSCTCGGIFNHRGLLFTTTYLQIAQHFSLKSIFRQLHFRLLPRTTFLVPKLALGHAFYSIKAICKQDMWNSSFNPVMTTSTGICSYEHANLQNLLVGIIFRFSESTRWCAPRQAVCRVWDTSETFHRNKDFPICVGWKRMYLRKYPPGTLNLKNAMGISVHAFTCLAF